MVNTKLKFNYSKVRRLFGWSGKGINFRICFKGDLKEYGNHGKGPVWWYPMEKMYDDANRPTQKELEEMKTALREELDKLVKKG